MLRKKQLIVLSILIIFPLTLASETLYFDPTYRIENGQIIKTIPLPSGSVLKKNGVVYYTHTDHLGSTTKITDVNGSEVPDSGIDYYPYGEMIGEPSSDVTENKFTGQILDDSTGLYYYNARYYNPYTGTFISADSVEGPNRYAYAAGNPINKNDPSGHFVPFLRAGMPGLPPAQPNVPRPSSNPILDIVDTITAIVEHFVGTPINSISTTDPLVVAAYRNDPRYQWNKYEVDEALYMPFPIIADVQAPSPSSWFGQVDSGGFSDTERLENVVRSQRPVGSDLQAPSTPVEQLRATVNAIQDTFEFNYQQRLKLVELGG